MRMIPKIKLVRHPDTGEIIPEEWRDISNYEGLYQVSNYGRITSLEYQGKIRKTPLLMSPNSNGTGYLKLTLTKNKKKVTRYVHRLVANAFALNPENHPCVDHINGNRGYNYAINLRFCSHRQNVSFDNVKHKNKTSKFVGVSFEEESQKWRSEIRVNGKLIRMGRFSNELDASIAYQQKLKELSL